VPGGGVILTNLQLTVLALAALLAHALALAFAIMRGRAEPALILNLAVGGVVLVALAQDLRWLRPPVDLQVAGLAAVEFAAVVVAALAVWGRYRAAFVGSWVVFGVNFLASGLAVAFIFTFKITRLI
jgi:hypothetical protein